MIETCRKTDIVRQYKYGFVKPALLFIEVFCISYFMILK